MSQRQVDAAFVEIVCLFYREMVDHLTIVANRDLERIQRQCFPEDE